MQSCLHSTMSLNIIPASYTYECLKCYSYLSSLMIGGWAKCLACIHWLSLWQSWQYKDYYVEYRLSEYLHTRGSAGSSTAQVNSDIEIQQIQGLHYDTPARLWALPRVIEWPSKSHMNEKKTHNHLKNHKMVILSNGQEENIFQTIVVFTSRKNVHEYIYRIW